MDHWRRWRFFTKITVPLTSYSISILNGNLNVTCPALLFLRTVMGVPAATGGGGGAHGLPLRSQLVSPDGDRLREVLRRPVYRFPCLGSCVMALQPAITATLACAASRVFSATIGLQ